MAIRLDNGRLQLVVAPELGGCVVRFDALTAAGPLPLFRPGSEAGHDPNKMGLYPLLPWSNRISGGGFDWRGRHYSLAANLAGESLPIHGDGWQRPWQVEHQGQTELRLGLCSSWQPPFDYRAVLTYRLEEGSLTVELMLTHLGDIPAPYGLGLHPWFPRSANVRLEAPADGVWEVDVAQLPTRWHRLEAGDPWSYSTAASLPAGRIDNLFTGWNGQALLNWPERGIALDVTTLPNLSRYLLFSPGEDADFFCFEPVSHDVDAHHFPDPMAHGLVELQRGQSLRQQWCFCLAEATR
ncbi:aldose 1-epimerase [Billgrantia montanilacus]|uniref:Aldose 1-epimerase n=1 Tax=Billgrantia montanilacus TaxID=2282305 RepID=A0A368TNK5_9GAMM|nr:aldose 1-epimerase [Halomonas montanilacus]RCV86191.1 aldose 1-epimerase [Halomonas montanilacus]